MSIISAAALSRGNGPILPFANSSDASPTSTAHPPVPSGWHGERDPATRVDLSDKVKGILERASNDQDVADRLKAFVEAHRIDTSDASTQHASSSDQSSSTDVNRAFEQLSGATQATDDSQVSRPVDVALNFADIFGPNGASFLGPRFGTAGEISGFASLGAVIAAQAYQRGNKEYITFSESEIAATSVTASSDAGSVSANSLATHTAAVTFVVDFATGGISLTRSESTSLSTEVQISQPGSTLSAVA
jgi:hypothetical protein